MTNRAAEILKKTELFMRNGAEIGKASAAELHDGLARAVVNEIADDWRRSGDKKAGKRRAYYFSAEFLMGRAIYNNLLCLGLTDEVDGLLGKRGASLGDLEEIGDAALGNGGLGRLAACYLDSAATLRLPLDGYGIRYRYGLFRQTIENCEQKEEPDDWTRHGDPWSIRREQDAVTVHFKDQDVLAVPYDMPILGYKTAYTGTLRLWQAEPTEPFDFALFNEQDYDKALHDKNAAENISRVLYPNDDTDEGKILRIRQEYFFSSASIQDILRKTEREGGDIRKLGSCTAVQLNDTHPVLAIPELVRLLTEKGLSFDEAFGIARQVFSYTNHTIMAEALEKWKKELLEEAVPGLYEMIEQIDEALAKELAAKGIDGKKAKKLAIIEDDTANMAHLAIFAGRYTNGVARIHTNILKERVLREWYEVYPERFQNVTNGVTQRRWLALCNPGLSELLTRLLGDDGWKTDLSRLEKLIPYGEDAEVLKEFREIKDDRRRALAQFLEQRHGIAIDTDTVFDVQIKRIHEYKRQLLNILAVLELYFEIKEGKLTNFQPTTFLFAGKSAPGYARAKCIIKLIGRVGRMTAADPDVSDRIRVVFIPDYNVTAAEKIVAAADVSEQISTAGTEASGTGNMKLMANGAVTLGTLDGATVEIVEEAGEDANYIFGARVEEIERAAESYDPMEIYESDPRVKRVLDALTDGTLGADEDFAELKDSLLVGSKWEKPDKYYLLLDFGRYLEAKIRVNRDYADRQAFAKKGWRNICCCGKFSSDRAVAEYAEKIWGIEPIEMD